MNRSHVWVIKKTAEELSSTAEAIYEQLVNEDRGIRPEEIASLTNLLEAVSELRPHK